MSSFTFQCEHCSQSFQLPISALGTNGNCPSCKKQVQIKATQSVSMQEQLNTLQPQSIQSPIPQTQLSGQHEISHKNVTQQQSSVLPTYSLPPAIKGTIPTGDISKQDLIKRDAKRRLEHAAQAHSKRQNLFKDEKSLSSRIIAISAGSLLLIILVTVLVIVVYKAGTGFSDMQSQVADSVENIAENIAENTDKLREDKEIVEKPKPSSSPAASTLVSNKQTIRLGNGTVQIEGDGDYGEWCSLHYERNDGLVLECDFKRGGISEFGYDLTEPTVNRTVSKLAAFLIARGIIKNFLDGEYD